MILAILLLPSIAWSQSLSSGTQTNVTKHEEIITNDQQITTGRLNTLELGIKELQNGRPTITGIPTFSQGASFTGNTTLSSGATISGPLTITSSITFTGSAIASNNIVHNSSSTIIPATNTTQSAYGVCIVTVTITTGANPVMVWASGMMRNDSGTGGAVGVNVLQDGAPVSPYTSAIGILFQTLSGTTVETGSFLVRFPTVTAASHSWCLSVRSANGTDNTGYANSASTVGQFGVYELK